MTVATSGEIVTVGFSLWQFSNSYKASAIQNLSQKHQTKNSYLKSLSQSPSFHYDLVLRIKLAKTVSHRINETHNTRGFPWLCKYKTLLQSPPKNICLMSHWRWVEIFFRVWAATANNPTPPLKIIFCVCNSKLFFQAAKKKNLRVVKHKFFSE